MLLFNPPYVPTSNEEADLAQSSPEHSISLESRSASSTLGPIAGAWAGGEDGMNVTNILLDQVEVSYTPFLVQYLISEYQLSKPTCGADATFSAWPILSSGCGT